MEEPDLLLGCTLVLVAHPDDEVIGCGALLGRMRSSIIVFATDGAPRDRSFWTAYSSREAYAEVRRQEALLVAKVTGASQVKFLCDTQGNAIVDQELFRNLPSALEDLRHIIADTRPDVLLTLAYEGGHPDHDCCSFLSSIVGDEFYLPAWEMPLYHRTPAGEISRQQFLGPGSAEFVYDLSQVEQAKKSAMINLYRSQQSVLKDFTVLRERFRLRRRYDYSNAPHPGALNYEAWGWPMSGREVKAAFGQWLEQLHAERTGTHP